MRFRAAGPGCVARRPRPAASDGQHDAENFVAAASPSASPPTSRARRSVAQSTARAHQREQEGAVNGTSVVARPRVAEDRRHARDRDRGDPGGRFAVRATREHPGQHDRAAPGRQDAGTRQHQVAHVSRARVQHVAQERRRTACPRGTAPGRPRSARPADSRCARARAARCPCGPAIRCRPRCAGARRRWRRTPARSAPRAPRDRR